MEPKAAAALILRDPEGRILFAERNVALPFLGGFVAFVGGRIEPQDAPLAEQLFGEETPGAMAAVLRELLEETGLLLTADGAIQHPRMTPLAEAYAATGTAPPPKSTLRAAGRWVTPSYLPIRFDTQFFLVDTLRTEAPEPDGNELVRTFFQRPTNLIEDYRALKCLVSRPTQDQLQALADGASPEELQSLEGTTDEHGELRGAEASAFEPVSGIWQFPLRTPTLPPATHTNCYLVGHEQAVVIDPAPYDEEERAHLGAFLDARVAAGTQLQAVVLTHHHPDHMGAARWVADRFGLPVLAHPVTADLLRDSVEVDEYLVEGDVIDLGRDATGTPFTLECLHTPGHAAGHLVFLDRRRGGYRKIVGDMVAGIGTIIVDPDEGSMRAYVDQLVRLRELPDGVVFPAHGGPIVAGRAKFDHYVRHRLAREDKVRSALADRTGPASARDLLPRAYADTPEAIWPLAERACLAHLIKLVEDGEALFTEDGFTIKGERS